jgi:hypothetical protein
MTEITDRAMCAKIWGMARFVFVVRTNPVQGREDEYNEWYSNRHLADLLAVPGVVSARRFKLADFQTDDEPQAFKYLALYEVEAADAKSFFAEFFTRAGTDQMPISVTLADGASAVMWEAL